MTASSLITFMDAPVSIKVYMFFGNIHHSAAFICLSLFQLAHLISFVFDVSFLMVHFLDDNKLVHQECFDVAGFVFQSNSLYDHRYLLVCSCQQFSKHFNIFYQFLSHFYFLLCVRNSGGGLVLWISHILFTLNEIWAQYMHCFLC